MDYKDLMLTPQRIIAEKTVPYRPGIKLVVGSTNAAILLSQISYWWETMKAKPFYKFAAPCNHEMYKEGDSWQEELCFSRWEYEGAMKLIATRIEPGKIDEYRKIYIDDGNGNLVLAPAERIVLYWKTSENVTWYELNEELYSLYLIKAYKRGSELECGKTSFGKISNSNEEKPHSESNEEKPHSESLYIDYSQENTKKKEDTHFSSKNRVEGFVLQSSVPSKPEQNSEVGLRKENVLLRSPIALLIERHSKTKLTASQLKSLSLPRIINFAASKKGVTAKPPETYSSPDDLYMSDEQFIGFINQTVTDYMEWAHKNIPKEEKRRGYRLNAGMIKRITGYGESQGWLAWQERNAIPEPSQDSKYDSTQEEQRQLLSEVELARQKFEELMKGSKHE